ncbi:pirin family protein [Anaerobacillus sp. CMMVII]|uniref:pirin family protein n=1 Tax=Anaerobacillus sp. CMMVII TaxID=2755588 RepID=UPI0021B6F533|nr:pirin family protein [Anaerobacillus sp. CMMVII]MCT8139469.1 pirin family protein [Anaerobacillus sp. CMMVII]
MIKLIHANERFKAEHGWLTSNFSFSFANYYDPNNLHFGPLRVFNDDIVQPNNGFGMHPHKEMEIVSIVLEGELKHEDSEGNTATTTFGEIQRMSAGTGIFHSERNPSKENLVNFLQLWIVPDTVNLQPTYEKTKYEIEKMKNNLLPIVSKYVSKNVAYINQDTIFYISDLEVEKSMTFTQETGRKIYLFVIDGELLLNEQFILGKRDTARITETTTLKIHANATTRFLLIDLP